MSFGDLVQCISLRRSVPAKGHAPTEVSNFYMYVHWHLGTYVFVYGGGWGNAGHVQCVYMLVVSMFCGVHVSPCVFSEYLCYCVRGREHVAPHIPLQLFLLL